MGLEERNEETRTGKTKVTWGTDIEACLYEAHQVGVCPEPKARETRSDTREH